MADTVLPPVRGLRRIEVAAALTLSGAVTGAAAGAALGVLLGWLPDPGPLFVGLVVALTVALEVAPVRPPAVGRQVPVEWGRVFEPATAAVLYGARLGIGPSTILTSWAWWTGSLLAATAGPLAGAVGGLVFHLARVTTTLAAGPRRIGAA